MASRNPIFHAEELSPRLFAIFRRHAAKFILAVSAVALVTGAYIPAPYPLLAFLACGIFALILLIGASVRSAEVRRLFPEDEIVDFVFDPHPISSLFATLARHIPLPSVRSIEMMSADINNSYDYYRHGDGGPDRKALVQYLKTDCPNAKVTVYGPSNTAYIPQNDSRFTFVRTSGPLITHTNLIVTDDGRSYVWFEPYHRILGQRHFFTGGAYLVKIGKNTMKRIQRELDELVGASKDVKSGKKASPI